MSDAPTFFAETAADVAEFDAVAAGTAPETPPAPAETPAPEAKPAESEKPAAEVKAETKPAEQPKPSDERPKFVPHAALHEERLKRQALERELAELRAGKQPEPEKPAEIDPETDPIAALKEVREFQAKQRQEAEQQAQLRAFDARVQAHEKDFADVTPDYGDAVAFLREARGKQIQAAATALGKTISPQELGAILLHEARSTSNDALNNGRNPGEVFYTLAKSFGYTGKQPEAAPAPKVETPAPPPVAALPTKEAEETIDRITRGQRAANKVSGGEIPDGGEITLESLVKLEGAAFDKAFEKFSRTQRSAH